jgi:hypothetical protein
LLPHGKMPRNTKRRSPPFSLQFKKVKLSETKRKKNSKNQTRAPENDATRKRILNLVLQTPRLLLFPRFLVDQRTYGPPSRIH